MLSIISIPVTALAVGLPAQRAIAQRFSALAPCDRYCSASEFPLSGVELPRRRHSTMSQFDPTRTWSVHRSSGGCLPQSAQPTLDGKEATSHTDVAISLDPTWRRPVWSWTASRRLRAIREVRASVMSVTVA